MLFGMLKSGSNDPWILTTDHNPAAPAAKSNGRQEGGRGVGGDFSVGDYRDEKAVVPFATDCL